jgi:GT2 family glycosyltransferase
LDDDVEVEPDLLERHLALIEGKGVEVSTGGIDEVGVERANDSLVPGPSDVFPTCNSMVKRSALTGSGLFDLAFDTGARADHDLGMRLYLSGAALYRNPGAEVLHHRAPRGGLREHKARKITYAASRKSLTKRHLPKATEVYLWRRYYSKEQVHERLVITLLATLTRRGSLATRAARFLIGVVLLPDSLIKIRRAKLDAARLAEVHPTIPSLTPQASNVGEEL